MKILSQLITALNLFDASGKINLAHTFAYCTLIFLLFSRSEFSLIAFGLSSILLGVEMWVMPAPKAEAQADQNLKKEIEDVAKDLRTLKVKIGFRQ